MSTLLVVRSMSLSVEIASDYGFLAVCDKAFQRWWQLVVKVSLSAAVFPFAAAGVVEDNVTQCVIY